MWALLSWRGVFWGAQAITYEGTRAVRWDAHRHAEQMRQSQECHRRRMQRVLSQLMEPHTSVTGGHVYGQHTEANMAECEAAWDAMIQGDGAVASPQPQPGASTSMRPRRMVAASAVTAVVEDDVVVVDISSDEPASVEESNSNQGESRGADVDSNAAVGETGDVGEGVGSSSDAEDRTRAAEAQQAEAAAAVSSRNTKKKKKAKKKKGRVQSKKKAAADPAAQQ